MDATLTADTLLRRVEIYSRFATCITAISSMIIVCAWLYNAHHFGAENEVLAMLFGSSAAAWLASFAVWLGSLALSLLYSIYLHKDWVFSAALEVVFKR